MIPRRFVNGIIPSLFMIAVCLSCKPKKSEGPPETVTVFNRLDSLLRIRSFKYDTMQKLLTDLRSSLPHSLTREKAYHTKSTHVTHRWNSDSTLAMIDATKHLPKGFSREVIVHSGDSILFVHRFNTAPLDVESPEDYTFLEAVYYLKNTGTIKHISRIEYDQSSLADTTAFGKKAFFDETDPRYHYYSMELGYARNVFED